MDGVAIRAAAEALGHRVTVSKSHWSTVETFKDYIRTIIEPNYTAVCAKRGLKQGEQKMLLQLDPYAVHRAAAFVDWLREKYPYIVLAFVPGGCTGAVQIPDTCLNRPFKAHVKECFSKSVVQQVTLQLVDGVLPKDTKLDFTIKQVRNCATAIGRPCGCKWYQ